MRVFPLLIEHSCRYGPGLSYARSSTHPNVLEQGSLFQARLLRSSRRLVDSIGEACSR